MTQGRRARPADSRGSPATFVLIALNVGRLPRRDRRRQRRPQRHRSGSVVDDFGLQGSRVADGEWYRLVTGGFLHAGFVHIGFNMFVLFFLGRLLEPAIGTPRFVALYFASLLAGAFGALALTDPVRSRSAPPGRSSASSAPPS